MNLLWNVAPDLVVPMLLGLDGRALVVLGAVRGAVSVLQHANVDFRLGLLRWVFSTPDLHRWHHSADLEEANSNYGSTLIVWDLLFRTWRPPAGTPAVVGHADGASHPPSLWGQLVWPWRARQELRAPSRPAPQNGSG